MTTVAHFFALTFTLFLVIDALGNIPAFLKLLKPYSPKKQLTITLRELVFALILMVLFHYVGEFFLTLLGITPVTVRLSGGIILFLIALRLIFGSEESQITWKNQEPFIVPIAAPMIAGPSVLAIIMIFAQEEPSQLMVLGAFFVAWLAACIVFLCAKPIYRLLRDSGLDACQRLMGLIVALIALQYFIDAIVGVIKK